MRVYLGDLGHYTVKLTNNHTPINIGFIAAFIKHHLKERVDIKLFKDPHCLVDAIEQDPPDVVGLSNYIWCQSVSETVLEFYKREHPNGVAIWGGPNFPMNELHKAKQYLLDRPYVDFYIPFEGETPALNIVRSVLETGKTAEYLKEHRPESFEGAFFLTKSRELVGNKIGVQIPDLDTIPSPYLEGWMDPFLREGLHAMFETQRGCPYQCTFCHTGLSYYNKGRSFSLDRLKAEIKYIIATVADPTKTHLYITDSNFGMWPQDLEFAKWLNEIYEQTGFPLSFGTSTGKGRINLVVQTVLSHPKLMLTNSVQSLDDKVLKEIKRKNIPLDQLSHSQAEIDVEGKLSQPECILGLPLETRESQLNTLRKLTKEIGANIIYQYTLMLLPGTEIYTDASREEYQYNVKYRLLPTSYGEYANKRTFEIEEVSVGTKDLSFEEYLEMRAVFFMVHNVHSNSIYKSLIRYLFYLDDDVIDFFLYLLKKRLALKPDQFAYRVVEDYLRDTKEECFDSREELIAFYSQDQNYADLQNGKKGINLTHTYRTLVLLHAREWAEFVTESFKNYVAEKYEMTADSMKMIHSIVTHVMAQAECQKRYLGERAQIPTRFAPLTADLDYDVPALFAKRIDKKSHPFFTPERKTYCYYAREDAIKYISSFPEHQRTVDLALIVLRMDQGYLFPLYSASARELVAA